MKKFQLVGLRFHADRPRQMVAAVHLSSDFGPSYVILIQKHRHRLRNQLFARIDDYLRCGAIYESEAHVDRITVKGGNLQHECRGLCDRGRDTFEFLEHKTLSGRTFAVRSTYNRSIVPGHVDSPGEIQASALLHEFARTLPSLGQWTLSANALRLASLTHAPRKQFAAFLNQTCRSPTSMRTEPRQTTTIRSTPGRTNPNVGEPGYVSALAPGFLIRRTRTTRFDTSTA